MDLGSCSVFGWLGGFPIFAQCFKLLQVYHLQLATATLLAMARAAAVTILTNVTDGLVVTVNFFGAVPSVKLRVVGYWGEGKILCYFLL